MLSWPFDLQGANSDFSHGRLIYKGTANEVRQALTSALLKLLTMHRRPPLPVQVAAAWRGSSSGTHGLSIPCRSHSSLASTVAASTPRPFNFPWHKFLPRLPDPHSPTQATCSLTYACLRAVPSTGFLRIALDSAIVTSGSSWILRQSSACSGHLDASADL